MEKMFEVARSAFSVLGYLFWAMLIIMMARKDWKKRGASNDNNAVSGRGE